MASTSGSSAPGSTSSGSVDGTANSGSNQSSCDDRSLTEISEWNYEDFDPKKPYLYEPLTYPPDWELHIPVEVQKRQYIPLYSLPKCLPRKRVNHSPEIKPKISKRTGKPKRSSQFLGPDSASSDSD